MITKFHLYAAHYAPRAFHTRTIFPDRDRLSETAFYVVDVQSPELPIGAEDRARYLRWADPAGPFRCFADDGVDRDDSVIDLDDAIDLILDNAMERRGACYSIAHVDAPPRKRLEITGPVEVIDAFLAIEADGAIARFTVDSWELHAQIRRAAEEREIPIRYALARESSASVARVYLDEYDPYCAGNGRPRRYDPSIVLFHTDDCAFPPIYAFNGPLDAAFAGLEEWPSAFVTPWEDIPANEREEREEHASAITQTGIVESWNAITPDPCDLWIYLGETDREVDE